MGLVTTTFRGSGEALGAAVGERFRDLVAAALDATAALHGPFLELHASAAGQALFRRLVELHEARYAAYVDELRGVARGAGVSFEHLFLVNLRGEYRGYTEIDEEDACSTCVLLDDTHAVFGHNEDGAAIYRERSYLIRVEPDDAVPFTALCYPGFLPGNAFGFNDYGLCFSVNNVRPWRVREGLGRHFLARSLFAARDIEGAVARLCVTPRAAGFNFTLGSRAERRIVNVEVAPDAVDVRELTGTHFHANHYLYLDTPQRRSASSRARQSRGEALLGACAPTDARAVLDVLRDQGDSTRPIWRDGRASDGALTLLSALFDLDRGTLRIYPGPWQRDADPGVPLAAAPIPGG